MKSGSSASKYSLRTNSRKWPAGSAPLPGGFDTVLDATDAIVLPGLINLHQHHWYALFKGLADGYLLEDWVDEFLLPLSAHLDEEAIRIASHVAGLRESLDAIRDALADAAARPVAIAVPEPAVPEDDAKSQDDAPRVEIVEPDDPEDEDGEEELDRIGTANTITVVNKIPPSLLKVLRQQFQLMEGWMEPLLKSSQAQQGEMKQLREQIETTLDDYERLIGQVRSSKSKRSRARRSDKK